MIHHQFSVLLALFWQCRLSPNVCNVQDDAAMVVHLRQGDDKTLSMLSTPPMKNLARLESDLIAMHMLFSRVCRQGKTGSGTLSVFFSDPTNVMFWKMMHCELGQNFPNGSAAHDALLTFDNSLNDDSCM